MVVGISGKMGSGKDLVYNMLCELSSVDFENKKFAYPIKWIVSVLIGCDIRQLEDREFKETELGEEWDGLTPRKLLQLLGTEAGREIIHPNIWVNALFADYSEDSNWIITDVRFPNEAKAIKNKGGILIRVERPGIESHCGGQHLSETSLDAYDKFDYVIENDGTVQDLIDKVKALNIV